MVFVNKVSPSGRPSRHGTSLAYSSEHRLGLFKYETSVCQVNPASAKPIFSPFSSLVRDQQDFRIVGQQIFLEHMDFQFAEAAAEFNMTFVRELLAAEIDHDVIVEGLL